MAKVELRLRSFIPHSKIFYAETPSSYVYFRGDNRNAAWSGTFRTSQIFVIDTAPSSYSVQHTPDTGTTHQDNYDKVSGTLISTQSGKASTSGLTFTKRVENGILYLDCKCAVGNPLVLVAPDIDYEFTLKVTRNGTVRITGDHDGFPGYELWRKIDSGSSRLVWSYDPIAAGKDINALLPPMDKSADKELAA